MERITSLSEDAANLASARAKRAQILDGIQAGSGLADSAGLNTEDIFEALAAGRDKTDPDFYTFKIMQYLYSYMPFGKYGRWFVPILLVYGLYKAAEKAADLVQAGWGALKTSAFYQTINAATGNMLPKDERIAHFGEGSGFGFDTESLQIGIMSVAPPFVSMIVTNQLKREQAGQSTAPTYGATTLPTTAAQAAPVAKSWKQILLEGATGIQLPAGTITDRRMARDRVVRDGNSPNTTPGIARIRKGNY